MRYERVTKNGETGAAQCHSILCSPFLSLIRTACYEQSNKPEIASYLKLKVQTNYADTGWWRNNAQRLPLLK